MAEYIVTKQNPKHEDEYQDEKVTVYDPNDPKVERKEEGLSFPTDPATQEYLRSQLPNLQRAYGINPQTGEPTPFEVLGYKPEDERKRREAERALNDRKRKENAWYNAFAVLGDSLTAALGGNVWERQPNKIGEQARADNERLIAEQKAEDEANAAKLRAASAGYANMVDQLVKRYAVKTDTTTTHEAGKKEITKHGAQNGYTSQSFKMGDGNGDGTGNGSGSNKTKTVKIQIKNPDGSIGSRDFHIPANDYDALGNYLAAVYKNLINQGNKNVEKTLEKHGIRPMETGTNEYQYDGNDLLQSGIVFNDKQVRDEFVRIIYNDPSLSPAEKKELEKIINEYPTSEEEKKGPSWWERFTARWDAAQQTRSNAYAGMKDPYSTQYWYNMQSGQQQPPQAAAPGSTNLQGSNGWFDPIQQ